MKFQIPLVAALVLFPVQKAEAGKLTSLASAFCKNAIAMATKPAFWAKQEVLPEVEWVTNAKALPDVANTLIGAFEGDVLMDWFQPNVNVQRRLMRTFVNHAFLNGGVLRVKGGGKGALLVLDSSRAPVGPVSLFLTGQAFVTPWIGLRTFDLLAFDNKAKRTRNEAASSVSAKEGIYIFFTGMAPEHQHGDGIRKLMKSIFAIADREGRPIVTEVQREANETMAKYMGFEEFETWQVPATAPETKTLLRRPVAQP